MNRALPLTPRVVVQLLIVVVLLDGVWAWLAVAALTLVLVVRTHLEDQTLRRKLVGYAE